jgi:hypothetical protein
MKIVRVIGGLGNQMFQYAFYLALRQKDRSVKLDITGFGRYTLRQLEISRAFGIPIKDQAASGQEISQLKDNGKNLRLRKLLGRLLFSDPNRFVRNTHFTEPNFSGFYPEVMEQHDIYLDGYWQNERYFSGIAQEIRATFQWKDIPEQNLAVSKKMGSENSVAVHIRRLDRPHTIREFFYRLRLQMIWRVCSKKYYSNSMQYIKDHVEDPRFYIFTDHISWVQKNIVLDDHAVLVDWNRGEDSHWDLFLMTQCRHTIIAMSSYSWWGAWLNGNPERIIIAPKKWALRFTREIHLIPTSWIRI